MIAVMMKLAFQVFVKQKALYVTAIRVQIRNIRNAITITKLLTNANAHPLLAVTDINVKSIII